MAILSLLGEITGAADILERLYLVPLKKIDSAINKFGGLAQTAQNLGITAQALQALHYATENLGGSTHVLDSSLRKTQLVIAKAVSGNEEAQSTFRKLGLNLDELSKIPVDQSFVQIAEAIKRIEDPSRQLLLTSQLYGEGSLEIVDVLKLGIDGLNEARSKVQENYEWSLSSISSKEFIEARQNLLDRNEASKGYYLQKGVVPEIIEESNEYNEDAEGIRAFPTPGLQRKRSQTQEEFELERRERSELWDTNFQITSYQNPVVESSGNGFVPSAESFAGNNSFLPGGFGLQAMSDSLMLGAGTGEDEGAENPDDPSGLEAKQEALEAEKLMYQEHYDFLVQSTREKESLLAQAEKEGMDQRASFNAMHWSMQARYTLGQIAQMTQGVANSNKTMFEINKAARLAEAGVNLVSGTIRTWNAYPYPVNIPMTALHVATGVMQIQQLASSSYGGGGGGGSAPTGSGGGASTSLSSGSDVVTQPVKEQQEAKPPITIVIEGNVLGEEKWVEEKLAPTIKELTSRNVDFGLARA